MLHHTKRRFPKIGSTSPKSFTHKLILCKTLPISFPLIQLFFSCNFFSHLPLPISPLWSKFPPKRFSSKGDQPQDKATRASLWPIECKLDSDPKLLTPWSQKGYKTGPTYNHKRSPSDAQKPISTRSFSKMAYTWPFILGWNLEFHTHN